MPSTMSVAQLLKCFASTTANEDGCSCGGLNGRQGRPLLWALVMARPEEIAVVEACDGNIGQRGLLLWIFALVAVNSMAAVVEARDCDL